MRDALRAQRRAIPAASRIAAAEQLAATLHALPFAPDRGHVGGYWAMDGEIALHAWQVGLPAGVSYCLPVLGNDRRMRFAPWRAGQPLATNRFGIPEPEVAEDALVDPRDMQFVAVPLVGFDAARQRLGMGGGWYDRSFAFRQDQAAPPWLVGVGFATQQVQDIGAQAWDVALDAICTEHGSHLAPGIAA